jgi:hypothetical protein
MTIRCGTPYGFDLMYLSACRHPYPDVGITYPTIGGGLLANVPRQTHCWRKANGFPHQAGSYRMPLAVKRAAAFNMW